MPEIFNTDQGALFACVPHRTRRSPRPAYQSPRRNKPLPPPLQQPPGGPSVATDQSVMDAEEYRWLRLWKRVQEEAAQRLYLLHVLCEDKRQKRMAMMALRS